MTTTGIWAALLVAPIAVVQAAYTPNVFFNWTAAVHDPMSYYFPVVGDPSAKIPWNTTFEGSPVSSYVAGQVGLGASQVTGGGQTNMTDYLATKEGMRYIASGSYHFLGSGFYAQGRFENSNPTAAGLNQSKALRIDGRYSSLPDRDDGRLVAWPLPHGYHELGLEVYEGRVFIDKYLVTVGVQTLAPSWDKMFRTTQDFVLIKDDKPVLNPFYSYLGSWSTGVTIGGVGGQAPVKYTTITTIPDGARVQLTVPDNTTFATLEGLVGPHLALLVVKYSPLPPSTPERHANVRPNNRWVAPSTLHFTPLDPAVQYTVAISVGQSYSTVVTTGAALHGMTFWSGLDENGKEPASTTSTSDKSPTGSGQEGGGSNVGSNQDSKTTGSKKLNVAVLAGGVAGGVVGTALIGLVAFLLWKRRQAPRSREFDNGDFVVDEIDDNHTPYVAAPMASVTPPEGRPLLSTAVGAQMAKAGLGLRGSTPSGSGHQDTSSAPVIVQEQDGGVVHLIPPSYDPSWNTAAAGLAATGASMSGSQAGTEIKDSSAGWR